MEQFEFCKSSNFFNNAVSALEYLKKKNIIPFLILSNVNLPTINGFEFKERCLKDEHLNYATVPFVFWSTFASTEQIKKAYDLGGHGFFIKGNSFESIKQSLIDIVNYWANSKRPVEKK